MTEQTETERNEAIGFIENLDRYIERDGINETLEKMKFLAISALKQQSEAVEPYVDEWAVCPKCGYEYILEIAVNYACEDNWLPKFCPSCGQEFKYGEDWKDENGRYISDDARTVHKTVNQSEAERRIERVREYCKHTASETLGHTRPYIAACEDILEILEVKAE